MPVIFEEKAGEVLGHVRSDEPGAPEFALATIVAIIEAICAVYDCYRKTVGDAVEACNRPPLFARSRVLTQVRRHLPDAKPRHRGAVADAILKMGQGVTEADFAGLAAGPGAD